MDRKYAISRQAVLADGHRIVAEGIAALMRASGWAVELVPDGETLLRHCRNKHYDVAVMDISSPVVDGLTALEAAKVEHLATPFILLSFDLDAKLVRTALARGALGVVNKALGAEELIKALDAIDGSCHFIPSLRPATPRSCFTEALTEREHEIVKLLSGGKRNREVAHDLGISIRTVESHRHKAMQKCGVPTLMSLIRRMQSEALI